MSRSSSVRPNIVSTETMVLQLGEDVAQESIITGSSAVHMALGHEEQEATDVDLVVSENVYRYLRDQPGWTEKENSETPRLVSEYHDVRMGLQDSSYEKLTTRSWRTSKGISVAGLPDMYAFKQKRGSPSDEIHTSKIRTRLHDATLPPLPKDIMVRELETARLSLPERMWDDPDSQAAIRIAANGLFSVFTLYGHPDIGQTNHIAGSLELPSYDVAATYHNGFDILRDMQLLQQHLTNVRASDKQRLQALLGDTYSDIIYGNGRASDNPMGHDELLSANLLRHHARTEGLMEIAEKLYEIVLHTGYNESTGIQRGKHHKDLVVRAVTGIDLQTLATPEAVTDLANLAIEDGMSRRHHAARTIGRVASEHGVRIWSISQGLEFVDEYAHMRPADAPQGPTVMQVYGGRIAKGANFFDPDRGHAFPDGWTLDNPEMRRLHRAFAYRIGDDLLAGRITAVEAYKSTTAHADAMRKQFEIRS